MKRDFIALQENDLTTLDDISVEVKPGKLLAVIGPVGAGKVDINLITTL